MCPHTLEAAAETENSYSNEPTDRTRRLLVYLGACEILAELGQLTTLEDALAAPSIKTLSASNDGEVRKRLEGLNAAIAAGRAHEAELGPGSWIKADNPLNCRINDMIRDYFSRDA